MTKPNPEFYDERLHSWGALDSAMVHGSAMRHTKGHDLEVMRDPLAAEREIQNLVHALFEKRGRLGKRHSQARQGVRRKLRRHGLQSSYAAAIREEIAK